MISVVLSYQEEITEPVRMLRYDDAVVEGLKMFEKLNNLNCAVVEMSIKTYGAGVHVNNDRIG